MGLQIGTIGEQGPNVIAALFADEADQPTQYNLDMKEFGPCPNCAEPLNRCRCEPPKKPKPLEPDEAEHEHELESKDADFDRPFDPGKLGVSKAFQDADHGLHLQNAQAEAPEFTTPQNPLNTLTPAPAPSPPSFASGDSGGPSGGAAGGPG